MVSRFFQKTIPFFKTLYLTINYITAKSTRSVQNWNEDMAHFLIKIEGKIEKLMSKST